MAESQIKTDLKCFHCGEICRDEIFRLNDKSFCCYGCKTVFEILDNNNLCEYYALDDKRSGVKINTLDKSSFDYLDDPKIRKKILEFDSDTFSKVKFFVPNIHCISCIWLLENLRKVNSGILKCQVNFARKNIEIDFNPSRIKLSEVAVVLSELGYSPQINLDSSERATPKTDKKLVLKLSIAGFCFGNVMLFSFPEYLGLDHSDQYLMRVFSLLNLALSIPVFFYSASGYLHSAYRSVRDKQMNIDVPIAAGLIALFLRSTFDIATATGPGYLDSFTGLVFFLLIGRWFQSKTYESLSFDRDFTAYFPLAVNKLIAHEWKPVVIYDLKKGDRIRIRNMEVIPADSTLLDSHAYIDYSFVTGESKPVKVQQSELIYAGGRLIGAPVNLLVEKETSQSHLTGLWNNEAFRKTDESTYQKIIDNAARRFTWIVITIAVLTFFFWQAYDPSKMWLVLTSVLMVACPCALALAAPFTFGSMLRVFGRHNLYLKNADVIERLAAIDAVVFDKTGTITHGKTPDVQFVGTINSLQLSRIKTLTGYSTHPLSMIIHGTLPYSSEEEVQDFKELPGKGIQAIMNGQCIKIGSQQFVTGHSAYNAHAMSVFVSINNEVYGHFCIKISIRQNLNLMLRNLGDRFVAMLSGDNESDKHAMKILFPPAAELSFNQSPHDKLSYIQHLQRAGKKVLMVGDGLNDAGALKKSDVGISITENAGIFTPACDGILLGEKLETLDKFLSLAKSATVILKVGFAISFFYNAITLTFAVTGNLTPLVAAILMPISSISVVGFSSIAVRMVANNIFKR